MFYACLVLKDANDIHSILVMLLLYIFDILPVMCCAEGLHWLSCFAPPALVLRFDFLNVS